MKQFTRYHKLTGQIICQGSCADSKLEWQETEDYGYIEGHHDSEIYYVANNELVKKPVKPDDDHDWDAIKKKWSLNQQRKDEKDAAKVSADARQAEIDQHEAEHAFIRELMKSKKNG